MLNADAKILFWISTLLLVFVLVNIFVAIILNAYDVISKLDPDSSDASLFISMVQTQALKTIKGATTVAGGEGADEEEVRRDALSVPSAPPDDATVARWCRTWIRTC